jgi:hypothetical protein
VDEKFSMYVVVPVRKLRIRRCYWQKTARKPEGKRPLGRRRLRWKNNISIDPKGMRREDLD